METDKIKKTLSNSQNRKILLILKTAPPIMSLNLTVYLKNRVETKLKITGNLSHKLY